jgi:hypothetical protein
VGKTDKSELAASRTPVPVGTPPVSALAADVKACARCVSVATWRRMDVKSGPFVREEMRDCSAEKKAADCGFYVLELFIEILKT